MSSSTAARPVPGGAPAGGPTAAATGLAPAAALALYGAWCGTFAGGATAGGALVAQAGLLAAGVAGLVAARADGDRRAPGPLDPLALGRAGRWLLGALLASVALSWWLSPVPRAGRVGLALLPAALLAPAAVAGAWRSAAARRWGARGAAVGVAGVAAIALLAARTTGAEPAAPLGHHNLLVVFLVLLLPLAALPWREGAFGPRLLAAAAVLAAVAAIALGRPLAGTLALGAQAATAALLVVRRLPRDERGSGGPRRSGLALGLAALALAAIALWGPRAADLAAGRDPSLLARGVYWRAGVEGLLERPATGWGPGSTAWTLPLHLRPLPGVNPPSELVGELHSLPVAAAYELGLPGLLLALGTVGVFARRRLRELEPAAGAGPGASDPAFAAAGLLGLLGGAVAGLATGDWRVTALPVAAIVVAGAAIAGGRPAAAAGREAASRGWPLAAGAVYALAGVAALWAPGRAHLVYDRAVAVQTEAPRVALEGTAAAARLDPTFPLYPAMAAWLDPAGPVAERFARAADAAPGVAVFAATAGLAAEPSSARAFFERACRLDPLAAYPPFLLLTLDPDDPAAVALGARAIAAEPRLLAATFWEGRPDLRERVLAALAAEEGLDAGWREEVLRAAGELPAGGETARLAIGFDGPGTVSPSLHLFRRRPLPRELELPWAEVRLAAAAIAGRLPAATGLATSRGVVFSADC